MKLLDFALAPNPKKVRVYISEKKLGIPIEQVDVMGGKNRTPEFLGKARPRTQFNEPWISNLKAAEQTPVRAQAIGLHIGVAAIVLGTRDTEPIA